MHKSITVLFLFISSLVLGQTAQDFLDKGVELHRTKNYEEALEHYGKAIELNNELTAAYFNRGTVYLAMSELKEALNDFTTTIELDESFIRAYYSRASIYVKQKLYNKAIDDLDMVIRINEKYPNALILRGNLKIAEDDPEGGCQDFRTALAFGDKNAERFLENNCELTPEENEYLELQWPKDEGWRIGNEQETEEMQVVEYLRYKETFENWTEMGTMQKIKGIEEVGLSNYVRIIQDQARRACPSAKISILEKMESIDFPYIIFSIECEDYESTSQPQSQIWHVAKGKASIYANFWAKRDSELTALEKKKWLDRFKTATIESRIN